VSGAKRKRTAPRMKLSDAEKKARRNARRRERYASDPDFAEKHRERSRARARDRDHQRRAKKHQDSE